MNSNLLQSNFKSIYREFFQKNNLVLSGCFSLPWGPGGYGTRSDFSFITSKVNLKCYIGFNKIKEKKIIFKDIISYDIVKKEFVVSPFSSITKEEEQIIVLIKDLFGLDDFGLEIEILSETTRGHSYGFSGTFLAILSTGLYLLTSKISIENLIDYDDFVKSEDLKIIFEKALKLETLNRYGNTIGQTILATLKKGKGTSYMLSNEIKEEKFSYDDLKIKYEYFTEKYSDELVSTDLAIDYYMVFTGLRTDTKNIESYKVAGEKKMGEISDFIRSDLLEDGEEYFLNNFTLSESVKNNYISNISILSIKMISVLKKLYISGYNQTYIEDFIETVNQFSYACSLIEKQSSFGEDFKYFFRNNTSNSEEKLGIMPIYSGKIGGGYFIATKHGISRETIENTINNLRKIYPNIELEYSSYDDGESSEGIKIEQDLKEGIYSKYIDNTKFVYKNNMGDSYVGDFGEILENEKKGLLFDMINNKIYLEGVKLTSKDIHSQTTTIEVIIKLMENIGKELSNHDFPVSSYTTNKNDMFGKIVLPFVKLIEQKTSYNLDIECKGGITDFYMKLNTVKLKVGIVDRI